MCGHRLNIHVALAQLPGVGNEIRRIQLAELAQEIADIAGWLRPLARHARAVEILQFTCFAFGVLNDLARELRQLGDVDAETFQAWTC